MLTAKQQQLLLFIKDRLELSGISPSFDEMKDALGLKSKSGVHRLVNALEERGFIKRMANRARALEILKMPSEALPAAKEDNVITAPFGMAQSGKDQYLEIPLHGKIAAGTPIEALENIDSHVAIPPTMSIPSSKCYALEISGDSMIEKGIMDGDTVIIESCQTARNGEIVVALVDREEATLKTFEKAGKTINLVPANRDHQTLSYDAQRVQIQGRLVGLMRQYH